AARDVADLKDGFEERAAKGDQDPNLPRQRIAGTMELAAPTAKGDQDPNLPRQRQFLRHLELQNLILEGNSSAAEAELTQLEGPTIGLGPGLAELEKLKFDPRPYSALQGGGWPLVTMLGANSPLGAVTLYVAGSSQARKYLDIRDALGGRMRADAEFFFRRGFLML